MDGEKLQLLVELPSIHPATSMGCCVAEDGELKQELTLDSTSTKMPNFLIQKVIDLHVLTAVPCEDETVENTE